jgi:hypothetical protein
MFNTRAPSLPKSPAQSRSDAEVKKQLTMIAEQLTVLKLQYKMKPGDAELRQSIKQLEDAEALVRKTLRGL